MTTHDATGYVILEATRTTYAAPDPLTGLRPIKSVRIIGHRANRPAKLAADQVAVRVTVNIPNAAFDPAILDTTIVIDPALFASADATAAGTVE